MVPVTTILYDPEAGEIASDSQDTDGMVKMDCIKLFRVNDHLIGTAGGSYSGLLFVRWFQEWEGEPDYDDRNERPDLTGLSDDDDFECIVVRPDKSCYTVNKFFVPYEMLIGRPIALGSGSGPALGAFIAGVDVKEAVRIACKIDACSGGRVQHLKVR